MSDTQNKKTKVAVGMSGGVDSSVAAALLKQQGYEVIGVFMRFWSDPTADAEKAISNKCCSVESMMDARRVATMLDIPLITLNLETRFKEYIVNNFLEEYEEGNTPNPCVRCNQFIKTGYFLEKARELGCEYIATGHYARVQKNDDGTSDLIIPKDLNKDQTYFLHRLNQDVISHVLFPLGDMEKSETRAIAEKLGLPTSKKQDSQEVCFVATQGHDNFLKKWVLMRKGKILDTDGNEIGDHEGLALYTIGQRKGLNLNGGPWYVVKKDSIKNTLTVTNNTEHPGLFIKEFIIKDVCWTNQPPREDRLYEVKLRYRHTPAFARLVKTGDNYIVTFEEGQRAVTSGQSAVVFDGQKMMGGGVII